MTSAPTLDLSVLFKNCCSGDDAGVVAELTRLKEGAVNAARHLPCVSDVEIALYPEQLIAAWRRWKKLTDMGPTALLAQLLESSRRSVPFYKNKLAEYPEDLVLSLADFEPATRQEMVRSAGQVFRDGLDPNKGQALHVTSGTTGRPLVVLIDHAMFYDMCYAVYGEAIWDTIAIPDRIAPGQTSVVLLSEHPLTWAGSACLLPLRFSVYRRVMIDREIEKMRRAVCELAPPVLAGLPTTLVHFAEDHLARCDVQPVMLFTSGETLFNDTRERLARAYNCPTIDAYISSEGGAIAISRGIGEPYRVRSHAAVVEVLTPNGDLLDEGEGELVVTSLLNFSMPFIRYRSGDYGRISKVERSDGSLETVIDELWGKDLKYFDLSGLKVPTSQIGDAFRAAGLTNFTLRQTGVRAFDLRCLRNEACLSELYQIAERILPSASLSIEEVGRLNGPGIKTLRYSAGQI
ncbi:MAG: AMP-binding protein [Hyphomicrobiales bacterium]|uniref:AMP-binding protein n=1 Tax=Roseibium sp. TaxID=1936156 RepID=UPI0032678C7B